MAELCDPAEETVAGAVDAMGEDEDSELGVEATEVEGARVMDELGVTAGYVTFLTTPR